MTEAYNLPRRRRKAGTSKLRKIGGNGEV